MDDAGIGAAQAPCAMRVAGAATGAETIDDTGAGELAARALAGIEIALVTQAIQDGLVAFAACALSQHRAIPVQAVSLQAAQDVVDGTGLFAWGVYVFDAQEPEPALMAGIDMAAEGSQQGTEMQGTGG